MAILVEALEKHRVAESVLGGTLLEVGSWGFVAFVEAVEVWRLLPQLKPDDSASWQSVLLWLPSILPSGLILQLEAVVADPVVEVVVVVAVAR